uniref:Glycosyltransferase 2-like domain-containing protein n=1 Tax=Hyaloperonospora arabidopsidis (strain Emoy2) TaxID=559515 RepID=M4BS43_HYAAE
MAHEWSVFLQQPVLPRYSKRRASWLRRVTLLRVLLLSVAVFLSWGGMQLLVRYGSISPAATALFTTAYDGRTIDDRPPVSPPWRPPFRVVVSLTTTPNRLDKIMDSVRSLAAQSLRPDQIYVNIPEGQMKRHPSRSYNETQIPSELISLAPLVRIHRCVDDGPATKLLGPLRLETNASTLIITLDDDFVYPSELVASLAWEALAKPEDALGVCGWGMLPLWHQVGVVPAYVPYFMRPTGRYVDILQACCGNAYRRGFFSDVEALADVPPVCVTVDDVWIAGYLRVVEHRHSALISKRLDPSDPPWKKEESCSSDRQMTLSSFNHEHQIHYKCVQALEAKFKRRWTRNFEDQAQIGSSGQ